MEKKTEDALCDLRKKIEALQAKRDAVLKKERERKHKAQEKWKAGFLREFVKCLEDVYGLDYEDTVVAEKLAAVLSEYLKQEKGALKAMGNETG